MARVLRTPEAFAAASLRMVNEERAAGKWTGLSSKQRSLRESGKRCSTEQIESKSKDGKPDDDGTSDALTVQFQTQLDLNCASEADIVNRLSAVRGVGILSINRIVTQRFVDGHFLNEWDFNRRVQHMSLRRLRRLSHGSGLKIKLGMTDDWKHPEEEVVDPRRHGGGGVTEGRLERKLNSKLDSKKGETAEESNNGETDSLARGVRRRTRNESRKLRERVYKISNVPKQTTPITIVSWNTARLSPHTKTFWGKIGHILTFVEDCKADIIALQEVHKEGLGPLCRALTQATGDSWVIKQDTFGTISDPSLAMLVRTSTVTLRQADDHWNHGAMDDTWTFSKAGKRFRSVRKGIRTLTRVPQVYSMRATRGGQTGRTVTFAHVHVSCSETRLETEVLGESLRRYNMDENSDGITMIVGDFNASATESLSNALRTAGFIELFSPRGVTADGTFTTVSSSTTAAGQWLDNVWVCRDLRRHVCDAWCFDVASRRRSLTQTRRAYAASRRAAHSDHLPLMVTLSMEAELQS